MTLVIDASVAIKWVLPEDGADRAAALRAGRNELIAPTLIAAEIGSAMRKHVAAGRLSPDDAMNGLRVASGLIDQLVSMPELSERALELSIALRHPVYDCFYLALAERERAPLITADRPLIAAGKKIEGVDVRAL